MYIQKQHKGERMFLTEIALFTAVGLVVFMLASFLVKQFVRG